MGRLLCICLLLCAFLAPDAAAQWKKVTTIPSTYASTHWLDVFFLPANPQYGWICGFNGHVLRTTNGGQTWTGAQVPSTGNLESVHFVNTSVGYASGNAGVFKSIDGGATWTNVSPATTGTLWGCYFVNASTGVVVGGGCGNYQHFYRTTDGGSTWSLFIDSVENSGLSDAILYAANGLGYAASSGRIWRTDNGGQTWAVVDTSGPKAWNEELTRFNSSFLVPIAGTTCGGGSGAGGMAFTTDNGAIWVDFTTGVAMFGAFLVNETTGWACGDARAVYHTSNGGVNWQLRNCGIDPGDLDDIWFVNDTTGWVVGQGVYRYLWPPYDKETDTLAYGEVCLPDTRLDTVMIYNRHTSAVPMSVALGGADAAQFELVSPASVSLASCDSARVIIRFRPASAGAKLARATVTFPGSRTVTVELRGTGRLQNASVVDTLVSINPAPVGVSTTGSIRWQNPGGLTETITGAEWLGGTSLIALMPGFPPLQIPSFGSTVYVYATPADTGWISTRFRFTLSPCNNTTTVTVRLYGVSPIITVADTVHFALNCRNEYVQAVPVFNTGNAPLVLQNASIGGVNAGDFTLLTALPKTIAPGAVDTLHVRFRPAAQGTRRAVLNLVNNDATTARGVRSPLSLVLAGEHSKASFAISEPQMHFGDVCVGDSTDLVLTIAGDATVTGTAEQWQTLRPDVFFVVQPLAFPASLPPGRTTAVHVRFRPDAPGPYVDTLRIYVQPCDTVLTCIVRGNGIVPASVVTATTLERSVPTDTDVLLNVEFNNPTTDLERLVSLEVVEGSPALRFSDDFPFPLQLAGGKTAIEFTGNAPDTGWFSARYRLVVQKGQCLHDTTVTLRLYGVSPVLHTRGELYFVLGTCNDDAVDTVYVRNTGNDTLELGAVSAPTGPHAGDFTVLGTTRSSVVPPGDSTGIIVRFAPSAPGKRTAAISFGHNDRRSRAALPHPYTLRLSGERGFVVVEAEPSVLQFDTVCVGARATATFRLRNTGSVAASMTAVTPASPHYAASVPGQTLPVDFGAEPVEVEVAFAPVAPGLHRDTVVVSIEPCGERYTFIVEGFAGESRIEAVPPTLALGDIRTGVPTVRTVTLTSVGNLPVHIESGALTLLPARSDLTMRTQPPLPVVLAPGASLQVEVELFPQVDTVFNSELCVAGTEQCPFALCLPVSARSTRSQLGIGEPGFGLVRCGSELFDTVEVRNLGEETVQIQNISIEPAGTPFSIVGATAFVLQPGATASVVLRAAPSADGLYTAVIVLDTDREGRKERELVLDYRRAALEISPASGDFGSFERCAGMLEIPVTLTSTGSLPDTVIIRRKQPVAGFSSMPRDTVIVPAGASAVVMLRATAGDIAVFGPVRDTFLLHSTACGDYTVPVSATLLASGLAASPSSVELGTVAFGAVRDTVVSVVVEGGTRRLVAMTVEPPLSGFSVDASLLPLVLAPGVPAEFPVAFTADRQGAVSASLILVHEGTCRDTTVIPLAAVVQDNMFRVAFVFDTYNAVPGDTIDIPLRYEGPLTRLPMSSLHVVLRFDRWLIEPLSVLAGDAVQVPFVFSYPHDTLVATLGPDILAQAGAAFGRNSAVVTLRALVLNSTPASTPLDIDSVGIATAAEYTLERRSGLLNVDGSCEPVGSILRRLGVVSVQGIAPHPAVDRIAVQLRAAAAQTVEVEVYDAHGRTWYGARDIALPAGESTLHIDAGNFPAGVYFVRVHSLMDTAVVRCVLVR